MTDKTHYRKAFNSPYLSSADIVEPTVLTIHHVELKADESKQSKDHFNTAFFVEKTLRPGEPLKPMILNVYNSKIMASITGSKWIEDWSNVPVTVYVDCNVRFGRDTVEGLRLRPDRATVVRPVVSPDNPELWKRAKTAFNRDKNLDAVKAHADISPENEKLLLTEILQTTESADE